MEMMVVLLIVAIVAAAAAPMVNKKILATANEKSPWVFTGDGQNIAYDINNNSHAVIGGVNPSNNAKLTIRNNDDSLPYVAFDNTSLYVNNDILRFTPEPLGVNDSTSDIVVLGTAGTTAQVDGGVAIGNEAASRASNSIAIGNAIDNRLANSIMIGRNIGHQADNFGVDESSIAISSNTESRNIGATSVAIGNLLEGDASVYSVSVGHNTAAAQSATAIGIAAKARGEGSIAIGSATRVENWVNARGNGFLSPVYAAISKTPSSTTSSASTSGDDSMKAPDEPPIDPPISEDPFEFDPDQPAGGVEDLVVSSDNETMATGDFSIAIGQGAETNTRSVAIGQSANANVESAVSIGDNAAVRANNSIAIGQGASVRQGAQNSVAIGQGAVANAANQIVLGRSDENVPTVVIPGDLVVSGTVTVAGNTTVGGILGVTGNTTVGGTLGVTGLTTLSSLTTTGTTALGTGNDALPVALKVHKEGDESDTYMIYIRENNDDVVGGDRLERSSMTYSDRRLKNVGEAFTAGLEEIKKLEVFNYTFKKDESKTPRVGVMAQDLEKIFPKAVFKGEDGFLRIRMEDMFYALVNAVKQLDAKIEELKNNEILTLKNRLDDLEKTNKELVKLNKDLQKQNEDLIKENKKFEKRLDKLEKALKR